MLKISDILCQHLSSRRVEKCARSGSGISKMCLSCRGHGNMQVLEIWCCSYVLLKCLLCLSNPSLVQLGKTFNSSFIFLTSSNGHIMPFFESSSSSLVLPSYIYLPMLCSLSKFFLLYSSSCISDPSVFFSSFHVTAAIFSPYLEPAILSLSMILRWSAGRLLPEHAWSLIPASSPSKHHPLTPDTFEHWH